MELRRRLVQSPEGREPRQDSRSSVAHRYTDQAQLALDMPWLGVNEVRRIVAIPYIRAMFALHGVPWGSHWRIFGMPLIQRHRGSEIILGSHLQLRSWHSSNLLVSNHRVVLATRARGAVIRVGNHCGLSGATLVAVERIEIGDRVLIGANVIIVDTDFHPLNPGRRSRDPRAGEHEAVVIGDDAFIGMNAVILKGVTVGRGSIVGAGAVVTRDIPENVVVAGNPATLVAKT